MKLCLAVTILLNFNNEYHTYIHRYCKGISDTEEKELRLFAGKRKQESLGKGMVVKFVDNAESNENTKQNLSNLDPNYVNGKEGKCNSILPNDRKSGFLSSACTEVININASVSNELKPRSNSKICKKHSF